MSKSRLDEGRRLLSREECERVVRRIVALSRGGGDTLVRLTSWWNGELRWARNRTSLAADRRDVGVQITRKMPGGDQAVATTNQLDDASLEAAVRIAERVGSLRTNGYPVTMLPFEPAKLPAPPETAIWSEATSEVTAEMRAEVARAVTEGAEAKGMLSAGFMGVRAGQVMLHSHVAGTERSRYDQYTNAQCSMTVRHPKGTGSGWAGLASYDWPKIDARALAERALEKCLASLDPVRIEPGRYTVILEPQAVFQLIRMMVRADSPYPHRTAAENPYLPSHPYQLGFDQPLQRVRSKLGVKMVDERVTISFDPMDPALGVIPYQQTSAFTDVEPVTPIKWFDRGVLTGLAYPREYALGELNDNLGILGGSALRMAGGDASVDEMIATTKRGLLVTRFSNMQEVHFGSMLMTGVTRDGLWLIENGKISKSVKNLRFTESPLFVLNQLESLGTPVPVFTDGYGMPEPAIVPPIKARDFSFTAMVDAV